MPPHNVLLLTHHITSRRKVQLLRAAARDFRPLYVLLRSGGSPGIMYAEGPEQSVEAWVATVKRLRYKDFRVARRTALIEAQLELQQAKAEGKVAGKAKEREDGEGMFKEVDSVREFGKYMEERGLLAWWRGGMGYAKDV